MTKKTWQMLGLALVVQLALGGSAFARDRKPKILDDAYLTVESMSVEEVASDDSDLAEMARIQEQTHYQSLQQKNMSAFDLLEKLKNGDIILDTVFNMGKKIWAVIAANKPVASMTSDVANAIPKGASEWEDLENWKAPVSRVFRVSYRNGYGANVVNFEYRILYTPGGQVAGRGQYLTHITVVPSSLQVAWAYKFNAQASVPSVTNAGSHKSPIGAAEILLNWSVDTIIKHDEGSRSYYVRGDGGFQDLSDGT